MRYSEKPLVGLIKECETTFRAKHAHRLNNDGAIVERWASMLCFIEPCPAGRRKYIGGMTVVSFRRVAVVGDAKSDLRLSGKERVPRSWRVMRTNFLQRTYLFNHPLDAAFTSTYSRTRLSAT
jgi:hypothetical protein